MIKVRKRNGKVVEYDPSKISKAIDNAFWDASGYDTDYICSIIYSFIDEFEKEFKDSDEEIDIEDIQDRIEVYLMKAQCYDVAREFILYRQNKNEKRNYAAKQLAFIENYKHTDNNANATIDDNSNVNTTSIASINNEIHKADNITTSRYMVMKKLNELFPDFDAKEYVRDLTVRHYCYKHDESSFAGAISPYCASISLYPFLTGGIKSLGGLSGAPKNLDSYCGMFCNLIFAVASQFAGAVASSEFLLYFNYFAKKKWGEDYYKFLNGTGSKIEYYDTDDIEEYENTIQYEICQKFQQVVYTINQPSGARGNQAVFWNVSYFSKDFFDGMFGEFVFPDGSRPDWESLKALQKLFMTWFNQERLKTIITFPVETVAMIYKDGEFTDKDMFEYTCKEYAEGHSMFTYISDTPDSLSSCCFDGDEIITINTEGIDKKLTISEFVNQFNTNINKNGIELDTNAQIKSFDVNGEKGLANITGILKKEYTGNMYTFDIDGKKVSLTADHLMLVKNKLTGEVQEIPAEYVYKNKDTFLIAIEQ